ncbi:MAG: hypothetical protein Q8O42_20070 [Acidobacteriota bacterium]|nr:hypothetical protein [Acidobacteriota bacterium]
MLRLAGALLAVLCLAGGYPSAQSPPALTAILDKMATYLRDYESQLSSVVADEVFNQRVVATMAFTGRLPKTETTRKRLESEVGFIRLPGGAEWLGFRDVRAINGRAVQAPPRTVSDVLGSGADVVAQAKAVADASAEHNLGLPRTTNVPTAALEVIHPRNYAAHKFEVRGEERIQKTQTVLLGFVETGRPTLIRDPGGQDLISRGRVWVDPATGAIWRVEWIYKADERFVTAGPESSLRVDFVQEPALGMLVPQTMREVFFASAGLEARGDGVATYKNFRRFGTSARILPPPP